MAAYSIEDKKTLVEKIQDLERVFGKCPLINVDLASLDPNQIDVVGVGGIVYTQDGSVVLVRRKETPKEWVIPGGGVDPGEDPVDSVKREVKEETGLEFEVDGLIRIGWAPDYSPPEFRESNRKRFGKDSIGLLLINFRGVESGGAIDWSNDPSDNILEVKAFREVPFSSITYSYRVMFVQQGLWKGNIEDYPVLGFSPEDR